MTTLHIAPGPVTTVTLNRPEVRNAFNEALIAELHAWALGLRSDASVRVVVLQGAGPVFCAGADLDWMRRMAAFSPKENVADAMRAAEMFAALDALPVPVIGRVQGAAMGGGVGLAAVCDIVVAAEDARFALSETTLGLVPAIISPYLIRRMGLSAARALCLHGQAFSAEKAAAVGLAHEVVPATDLDRAVAGVVAQFSNASPVAVAATKQLFNAVAGRPSADVVAMTAKTIAAARASVDGREGLQAFFEKRAPAWAATLGRPRS